MHITRKCENCSQDFIFRPTKISKADRVKKGRFCSRSCANRDPAVIAKHIKANTKHGLCGTQFYYAWNSMLGRCQRPKDTNYKKYGARGIKVCAKWQSFEGFKEDMYSSYLAHLQIHGKRKTSLDRIDFDKDYEKSNCRWATPHVQMNNVSTNQIVEYRGTKKTISQWAEITGLKYNTLWARIFIHSWSIDSAIETPLRGQ